MNSPALQDNGQHQPQAPLVEEATSSATPRHGQRRAATAMEYLFVISLILVVCISTIGFLGQQVKQLTTSNGNTISNATNKGP